MSLTAPGSQRTRVAKPKGRRAGDVPLLVVVHEGREDGVHVGARADQEENDEEERLEIEERRLHGSSALAIEPRGPGPAEMMVWGDARDRGQATHHLGGRWAFACSPTA